MISYNATISEEDRLIFEILNLLENIYKINMGIICPIVWGEKSKEIYEKRNKFGSTLNRTTPEQVLELLDGKKMWRTVLNHTRFPLNNDKKVPGLYDVRFLLRVFLSLIHAGSEVSVKLRHLFR
ncbi:hypothetical protein DICVIV_07942 [Dictyocaulus viviparus]|uniref:Uncharacterized protein n=1 Tax=Dictyocaulus viviparus TaxID=29172 RepID=A0A0D8XQB1_DICVI|nr:hypothetical protein DICVIV_07942 [Dictyocaulus viviparus]